MPTLPTDPIPHTPLNSSNLKSAGYDAPTRTLEVAFHSGVVFRYHDVAPHHFQNLTTSPSAGGYFHKAIKSAHQAEKVG